MATTWNLGTRPGHKEDYQELAVATMWPQNGPQYGRNMDHEQLDLATKKTNWN